MAEVNTHGLIAQAADVAFREVTGPGKRRLMLLLRDALASTAPAVLLPLSLAQAERALAALKGATFADAIRLARGCSDFGGDAERSGE